MTDFKIRRGMSTVLFSEPGVVNPKLVIEEGCWYLCTDTAELFLGVTCDTGLTLKRINGDIASENVGNTNPELAGIIEAIRTELTTLKDTALFQKLDSISDLPSDFETANFDPNITYFIQVDDKHVNTYIFDKEAQSYLCTNSADEATIYSIVNEAINLTLDSKFNELLPTAVKNVLKTVILCGGDANPYDD